MGFNARNPKVFKDFALPQCSHCIGSFVAWELSSSCLCSFQITIFCAKHLWNIHTVTIRHILLGEIIEIHAKSLFLKLCDQWHTFPKGTGWWCNFLQRTECPSHSFPFEGVCRCTSRKGEYSCLGCALPLSKTLLKTAKNMIKSQISTMKTKGRMIDITCF